MTVDPGDERVWQLVPAVAFAADSGHATDTLLAWAVDAGASVSNDGDGVHVHRADLLDAGLLADLGRRLHSITSQHLAVGVGVGPLALCLDCGRETRQLIDRRPRCERCAPRRST